MDTVRVEEVLGEFINIQRRGADYKALCPFHDEKSPSFSISPSKGIYKCFGCQKAGNAVTFLIDHENMSYVEAIRFLAKKYNIELEETQASSEQIEENLERESLFILNEYAAKYFQTNLFNSEEGKLLGYSYFKERGFMESTIRNFELGYCLDSYDSFAQKAIQDGFNEDKLIQLGLVKKNDDGKLYDFYRGRVMFPIHNLSGKIVGFGARVLTSDAKKAKYLNSPESPIYHKSNILYGMHQAKKTIPKENYCLLVEGYTDVISLHQADVTNVVSSSGTALTVEQLKLIRRFTENLYLLYDGDNAGINAALKGTNLALEQGLNVKVTLLPEKHDPDSYVKSHGGQALKDYIQNNAQDIITFKASLYKKDAKNDPIKLTELTRDMIQTMSHILDPIKRNYYVKECALIMEIEESVLVREIQKTISDRRHEQSKTKQTPSVDTEFLDDKTITDDLRDIQPTITSSISVKIESELIRLMIEYGPMLIHENTENDNPFFEEITVLKYILQNFLPQYVFESELCNKIFYAIKEDYESKGKIHPLTYYTNHIDPEISKFTIDYCSGSEKQLYNWAKNKNLSSIKQYGQNYIREVENIIDLIKQSYFEKLSKSIMDSLKNYSNETLNEFGENSLIILTMQQHFLENLKKEISSTANVFRKRIN